MMSELTFLRFLKEILHFGLWGDRQCNSIEISLVSESPKSYTTRLLMEVESAMSRLRVCLMGEV